MTHRIRGFGRIASVLEIVVAVAFVGPGLSAQVQETPLATLPATGAESASWIRPTSHQELSEFLWEVRARTDRVAIRDIGTTAQGRPIRAVFLGEPPLTDPGGALRSGKPTVLILASAHGDEFSGREGALQLIRSVALGEDRVLLESINLIVVPEMNPDGTAEGTRSNGAGYDLNRDWIVAESREVAAVLDELVTRYWPDIFVDVHNGGALPYHVTYQATLDPVADSALVAFARGPMYEDLSHRLASRDLGMFWYSGPRFDEASRSWYWGTTEAWPRKQHSYGGLQNMITLLVEVPDEHSMELGATAAREAMLGLARFASENAERVMGVVRDARKRAATEPASEVFLELEARAYRDDESFFVVRPNGDGTPAVPELVVGENRTRFVPVRTRPAPWGYAFDGSLVEVAELLRRHGVQVERTLDSVTAPIERFRVLELDRAVDAYQNHHLLDATVELDAGTATLPRGTFIVRVAQPSGRLVPQLLEPDAVDSLVRWNLLDENLPIPGTPNSFLPLYRLPERPEVASQLVP